MKELKLKCPTGSSQIKIGDPLSSLNGLLNGRFIILTDDNMTNC